MNKIKVIEFLKERGLNYKESPIPENIVKRAKKEYPDTWEEYLKKY